MRLQYIEEPQLEFGTENHVCPKAGISQYNVYDTKIGSRRTEIFVGAIGTGDTLSKLNNWLDKCSQYIMGKPNSSNPKLDLDFCGFNLESGFKAKLNLEEINTRKIKNSEISKITKIQNWNKRVEEAVDLYYRQIKFLAQNRNVDVIVCTIPNDLYDYIAREKAKPEEEKLYDELQDDRLEANFRRALKARTMSFGKPIQLIKELSLESNKKQQDSATKAWNWEHPILANRLSNNLSI